MNTDTTLVTSLSQPLYSARGWIMFLGIMSVIGGIFTAFSPIGLLVAWIPV